jgi:predicted hotdog family 3-hydroxylacyl-ACP dehydratase
MSTRQASLSVPIEQPQIRKLIPHAGAMCLLNRVLRFDADEIECEALSHRALDNPLRHNGMLPIHTGIEYCAQAIAVHGGLTATDALSNPRRGYLAVVLNTEWTTDRLDTLEQPLLVIAKKMIVLQQGVQYSFAIQHEGHALLNGQALVALE